MLGLGNNLATSSYVGFSNTYSLDFDGTDDYVVNDVANFRSSDSLGTISAWVKFDVVNAYQRIFGSAIYSSRRHYIDFYLDSAGKITCSTKNGESDTTDLVLYNSALSADTWYHVVLSSNGSAYSIYIDGDSKTITVGGGADEGRWFADISNRENFTIGALKHNSAIESPMNGNIDEVAIWDVALDADAVSAIYNSGTPIALDSDSGNYDNSANLQGWWRMGDGTEGASGTTIYDMSDNSNNGTWNGASSGDNTSINYSTDVP